MSEQLEQKHAERKIFFDLVVFRSKTNSINPSHKLEFTVEKNPSLTVEKNPSLIMLRALSSPKPFDLSFLSQES